MQETESIDEYILQHIDPENDYLKALYPGYARKITPSPYGFRAFTGADVENVCGNDSASPDTGNWNVSVGFRPLSG